MSDGIDFADMLLRLSQGDNGGEVEAEAEAETDPGPMEYCVHEVCLAYTWAVLTKRRDLARRLHRAISAGDFCDWILLSPELGQAVEEADRLLAVVGRPL